MQADLQDHGETLEQKITDRWLHKFKARHGIRQLKLTGEKQSSDKTLIDPFKAEFHELMEDECITRAQLYNCDETGLCWRTVPSRTLAGP